MAINFLDKFRSGLKAIQGRQVMALLSREKDKGSITTLEEFKTRLKELTEKISTVKIQSSLEVYLAVYGESIDSDSFNFMLQQIEDDLVAAFQEANDIDEVINSHESIINDVVLTNLELALNDIESQVDSIEFINNTSFGFDNAVFNTFRVTQNNRSSINQGIIFVDPKTLLKSGPGTEASIDLIGEKLILKSNNKKVPISAVRQIFDSEATGTELSVDFDNNSPNNIIDTAAGSFWVHSTLLTNNRKETGVITKLELDLSSIQNINFVLIEPIILSSLYLYRIDYVDENNQIKNLLINPRLVNTTNKLFFSRIATKKLILVFQNRNFFETQFEIKPNSPVTVDRDSSSSELLDTIKEDLKQVISSPRLRSQYGLDLDSEKLTKKYFEYVIGFKNIEVGESSFEEHSIFVSETEKISKLSQLGVKSLERRPVSDTADVVGVEFTTDTSPIGTEDYFHGSIEYYLMKRDFDINNLILASTVSPLLPIDRTVVRHERLILKDRSEDGLITNDVGYLQFYSEDSLSELKVYRNGIELTGTNLIDVNPFETDGWLFNEALSEDLPKQGTAMRNAIQIQKPNPANIYTVSYTPKISTTRNLPTDVFATNASIVDCTGLLDTWLGPDNLLYFSSTKKGKIIDYSLVNLVIVLRRNSSDVKLTPVVEEYLLATSTINQSKFGD